MNPLQFNITIPEFDSILLSLISILFLGTMMTSTFMLSTSKISDLKNNPVRQDKLQWPKPYILFSEAIGALSKKSKDVIMMNLAADNYFMICVYPLMALTGWFIARHFQLPAPWSWLLWVTCFLPFLSWVLDKFENAMTRKVLLDITPKNASWFFVFNIAKWVSVIFYLLGLSVQLAVCFL